MSTTTLKIVLRTDKANAQGLCPINIRITRNRKVSYVSTNIKIQPELWDKANCRVRKGHPNSVRVNHYLQTMLVKYTDESLKVEFNNDNTSIKNIKEAIVGKVLPSFFEYAQEILKRYKSRGSFGSYDRGLSILNKLLLYSKNEKLTFKDINVRFLIKYEDYLLHFHKNSINTIGKDMKFLRTVFMYAIKESIIKAEISPFKAYKIKSEPTSRSFLEQLEIELLRGFNGTALMNHCRDIVLFQYYSGGVRISDALTLRITNVKDGNLTIQIRKSGIQLSHKLTNTAIEIIQPYLIGKDESERLFPFIDSKISDLDNFFMDKAISSSTALINKSIKAIAKSVGLNKSISTHSFRHSFAINAIKKGIPIEYIQKILKHSNIRETMIYAKIQNNEIDEVLSKFDK